MKPGEYGGNITTNILEVEVKPEHHGSVFICEATNEELQESVHNARTMSVKCKPNNFLVAFTLRGIKWSFMY